jgi:hypothetical protein
MTEVNIQPRKLGFYFQWLFGQINNVIDDDNNKVKLLFMDSLLEVELNNIRNFSK